MPHYKDPEQQKMYDRMLTMAFDPNSELYRDGEPNRGLAHRSAFWDGASGQFDKGTRSPHAIPGSMAMVCLMAGREYARQQRAAARKASHEAQKGPVGRPAVVQGKRVQVYLDEYSLAAAAKLGAGNVSDGIRKALRQVQMD